MMMFTATVSSAFKVNEAPSTVVPSYDYGFMNRNDVDLNTLIDLDHSYDTSFVDHYLQQLRGSSAHPQLP